MQLFLYILLAIIILLVMIVIHEFGHYVAGKILKFKINEFSIGFGPKLISKKKKNGEVFTLRAIPLGGYCAFEDEEGIDETEPKVEGNALFEESINSEVAPSAVTTAPKADSFVAQKPWKRLIVFFAGAFFNFISAIIFSFIFILVVGYATMGVKTTYPIGGVPFNPEIREGDVIVAVDGHDINIMRSYGELLAVYGEGDKVNMTVLRDGERKEITVEKKKVIDDKGKEYIGFGFLSEQQFIKVGLGDALIYSVPFTCKMAFTILGAFGDLITCKVPITDLTGPIGTIDTIADIAAQNWRNILLLLPMLAANLAIFNLLPIPSLDGSKVVFTVIEWIRGKPINRKVENIIHLVGLALIFGLVILLDLSRLFI